MKNSVTRFWYPVVTSISLRSCWAQVSIGLIVLSINIGASFGASSEAEIPATTFADSPVLEHAFSKGREFRAEIDALRESGIDMETDSTRDDIVANPQVKEEFLSMRFIRDAISSKPHLYIYTQEANYFSRALDLKLQEALGAFHAPVKYDFDVSQCEFQTILEAFLNGGGMRLLDLRAQPPGFRWSRYIALEQMFLMSPDRLWFLEVPALHSGEKTKLGTPLFRLRDFKKMWLLPEIEPAPNCDDNRD